MFEKKKKKEAVVQFYSWLKYYFPYPWGIAMYNNEFETKELNLNEGLNNALQHTNADEA